jgi:hypothetical protein
LDNAFDRESFRRSAVILPEPPTHVQTVDWGYNPRPPTMIERKLANTPPTSHGAQEHPYGNQHQAQQFVHSGSQPLVDPYSSADQSQTEIYPIHTPNTVEPLLPPSVFAQATYSPLPSPVSTSYDMAQEQPARRYSTREHLNRQSSHSTRSVHDPGNDSADAHYVDLNRASVSPFQAAQYAELAMRLNADVLGPLPVITDRKSSSSFDIAAKKPATPAPSYTTPSIATANENFSIAHTAPSIATANENFSMAHTTPSIATTNENVSYTAPSVTTAHENISIENSQSAEIEMSPFVDTAAGPVQEPEEQDIAATVEEDEDEPATFRPRITSIPPVLPEFSVYQRTFSPTPFSATFDSVISSSAYNLNTSADQGPPAPVPAPAVDAVATSHTDLRNKLYAQYDPDDAYGGI